MSEQQRWFPNSMPPPMVDHYTLPWWQGAAAHQLLVQRCDDCRHTQLPPAPVCSECTSEKLSLQQISGNGTLYSYTTVHRPVAMEQALPFVIAVIELDMTGSGSENGVRLMSNIVDCDPDTLEIGMPVQVVWETMSEEVSVPRFRPT